MGHCNHDFLFNYSWRKWIAINISLEKEESWMFVLCLRLIQSNTRWKWNNALLELKIIFAILARFLEKFQSAGSGVGSAFSQVCLWILGQCLKFTTSFCSRWFNVYAWLAGRLGFFSTCRDCLVMCGINDSQVTNKSKGFTSGKQDL